MAFPTVPPPTLCGWRERREEPAIFVTCKVDFVKGFRDPSLSLQQEWQRLMRARVSFLEANALIFL